MKKENKITMTCYIVASICFYISAAICFISDESSMGILDLCLGSTFICLSALYMNKNKGNKK
ncbi:MAG: hypothetical protein J1F35_04090 [Erysipelotrichales bacterium]|nr:hypothetical protein [Erysipelotrichales bacterium]